MLGGLSGNPRCAKRCWEVFGATQGALKRCWELFGVTQGTLKAVGSSLGNPKRHWRASGAPRCRPLLSVGLRSVRAAASHLRRLRGLLHHQEIGAGRLPTLQMPGAAPAAPRPHRGEWSEHWGNVGFMVVWFSCGGLIGVGVGVGWRVGVTPRVGHWAPSYGHRLELAIP